MGRPSTKPKGLRDGFYLEVCNKGATSGIKIRRDTKEELQAAIEGYSRTKTVVVLGEYKNGKWLDKEKK